MRGDNYGRAALDSEVCRVLAVAPGGRAQALFRAACTLGSLIAAGILPSEKAEAALIEAGTAVGLGMGQVLSNVQRGLKRGARTPRQFPSVVGKLTGNGIQA